MSLEGQVSQRQVQVELPRGDHHQSLIACQVACPVHTDARGVFERWGGTPGLSAKLAFVINEQFESDRQQPEPRTISDELAGR